MIEKLRKDAVDTKVVRRMLDRDGNMVGVVIMEKIYEVIANEGMDQKEVREEYERRVCEKVNEDEMIERGQVFVICLVYSKM